MNILILIDSMNFGGAEKQALLDANALVLGGHNVDLVCFHAGDLAGELDERVRLTVIAEKSYPARIRRVSGIIRSNHIDWLLAHMFRAEVVGSVSGWMTGRYVVLNEHGLGVKRGLLQRIGMYIVSRLADEVWCASDVCRQFRVQRERVSRKKARVVYNCFTPFSGDQKNNDNKEINARRDEISRVTGSPPVIVGYVGRFDPVKRLPLLVDAAEQLREENILFVLVGDGIEMDKVRSEVERRGLSEKFVLPGFVHNPHSYYKLFDIFVLPSVRESLSMSLLEAGSYAVPAIAFDVGGNGEIIKSGKTGSLVADGDVDGLVQSISELVCDQKKRLDMGRKAKEFVTTTFTGKARMDVLLGICSAVNSRVA
ncbi:MAG: glycosyltransferase [Gammaproteobacteria bacterium]|nr:glycosyltransferase [Gammaproteobacteria bacterium]